MKICSDCGLEKDNSCFEKHRNKCKICIKEQKKQYRILNKDKIKKHKQQYYINNKSLISQKNQKYNLENKDKKRTYNIQYIALNKKVINEYKKIYNKKRRIEDPSFKLRTNISRSINRALNSKDLSKDGLSIVSYLNFSMAELIFHLESQFDLWMTWDNIGKYDPVIWRDSDPSTWTWQLDHIIPQSDLPYTSMSDDNFKKCWALNNLRPLSSKQNVTDGATRVRHNNK